MAAQAQKGFTLVEAMVAIAILSLAVTGPLVIAQKGIDSAIYSRDQVTAFNLAQEAVEYIRNIRDSNRIAGSAWLTGLSNCLVSQNAGRPCRIDAQYTDTSDPSAVAACPTGSCAALSFDPSSGLYGYTSGWTPTAFTREIVIDDTVSSKEASLSVTIRWNTNLFSPQRTFTVREYIFNF